MNKFYRRRHLHIIRSFEKNVWTAKGVYVFRYIEELVVTILLTLTQKYEHTRRTEDRVLLLKNDGTHDIS